MMSSRLLLACLALHALGQGLKPYEAVEPHMGTLFRIKLYAADQESARQALRAAFDRVAELDAILSDYKPDSELNRLARTAVRRPVHVSDDLFRILQSAQQLSAKTEGAFDITIGPLTHLWREARKTRRLPDASALEEAKERCGFPKLHLNAAQHTAELDRDGMQLDAGGIAKGDAADQALGVIGRCGIRSALVAASGDLAFSDAPPGEKGWKIGIDSLDSPKAGFTRVLILRNAAVSTSGPQEQHLEVNGTRYSHIIDPQTGMGLTRDTSVTVIAERGIEADSMSTALSVLGEERGLALIEGEPRAAAILFTRTRDGQISARESSRFQRFETAE